MADDLTTKVEDMTAEEHVALEQFVNDGCPGIAKIRESDMFQWFELYMGGRSYAEIARATKNKKEYILFIAKKQNWFDKKTQHYDGLLSNMQEKLKQLKIESVNNVSKIVEALGKYYGDKFEKFTLTGNAAHIDNVDTKMLAQFYKSIEVLDKIVSGAGKSSEGSGPLVNLNIGGDATVEQTGEKTIKVTSGEETGKLLKALEDIKKKQSEK